ncbi:hypothetical protein DFJ73DRAFT_852686, partial [Zopfochytrium polystomum]
MVAAQAARPLVRTACYKSRATANIVPTHNNPSKSEENRTNPTAKRKKKDVFLDHLPLASLGLSATHAAASPAPGWVYINDDAPLPHGLTNSGPSAPACKPQGSDADYAVPTDINGKPLIFSFEEAKTYCSMNTFYNLAKETYANQPDFEKLLAQCTPSKKAWIAAWNTDTYQGYPLFTMARTDGDVNSKSGVYIDITNTERMPAICGTSSKA